jgi:hypothetical protein
MQGEWVGSAKAVNVVAESQLQAKCHAAGAAADAARQVDEQR